MFSPFFDQDLGFAQAVEDFAVQEFITETGIEAFAVPVFPRAAWFDVSGFCRIGFNSDAAEAWLRFARAPDTLWPGNFRDFGGAILRLCTLAPRGRITLNQVNEEIAALSRRWDIEAKDDDAALVAAFVDRDIDPFDIPQLAQVLRTCQTSKTLSEAGRKLYAVSRTQRSSVNDSDRVRKFLARFNLTWDEVSDC